MAGYLGFHLVYHTHDSRHSAAGFPDLVLLGRGRLIFIEVKSETGQLSPPQLAWYAGLLDVGVEAYVWRPQHWLDGTIEKELKIDRRHSDHSAEEEG